MADPKFPYTTYIDRVITDEKYNVLFGENPGNVYDEINDQNLKRAIDKIKNQITLQEMQIKKQITQIEKQDKQIQKQETQIKNQEKQLDVLNDVVTELNHIQTKQEDQKDNQEIMIDNQGNIKVNQETMIQKQKEIKQRLDDQFDVIINGNKMELYGESTDTKPTDKDLKIGTTFFEMDTSDVYMYTGSDWVMI